MGYRGEGDTISYYFRHIFHIVGAYPLEAVKMVGYTDGSMVISLCISLAQTGYIPRKGLRIRGKKRQLG